MSPFWKNNRTSKYGEKPALAPMLFGTKPILPQKNKPFISITVNTERQ
jgi:hypothetical protein